MGYPRSAGSVNLIEISNGSIMKTYALTLGIVIAALLVVQPVCSQETPTQKIKKESHKVINKNIENLFGKKKKKEEQQPAQQQPAQQQPAQQQGEAAGQEKQAGVDAEEARPGLKWAKYDFVPGDRVIFEDNLEGEENGEFPSRWDLVTGIVEVAEFGGENVIMFRDGSPAIIPYFKEAREDYLPEVFTVEFDLYCDRSSFNLFLYDRKNQKSGSPSGYTDLEIESKGMEFGQSSSVHPDQKSLTERRWMHVAVAYTNGKLKAYMDETRLINIPRIDFDPKGITLYTYHARNERLYYVKNVRIAEGGVKYYDRVMQDGKIVATGIRFDTGKSTLKPESMGVINEIYELMEKHPELKFSVEGHTDNVGNDASNMTLSADRAERETNPSGE